jgi:antitoxin component YwqK of YwqJK toxin-antitoxin module
MEYLKIQEIFSTHNNMSEKAIGYHYDGRTKLYELIFSERGIPKSQLFFYENGKIAAEVSFCTNGNIVSLKRNRSDGKTSASFTTFVDNLPVKEVVYKADGISIDYEENF